MKPKQNRVLLFTLLIFILILLTSLTLAAAPRSSGGNYSLNWTTTANSGIVTTGGDYTVMTSSGQVAAVSDKDDYQLTSGFLGAFIPQESIVYLPVVTKP